MNFTLNSIVVTDLDDRMLRVTYLNKTLKIEGFDGTDFYPLTYDELQEVELLDCDDNYKTLLNMFLK